MFIWKRVVWQCLFSESVFVFECFTISQSVVISVVCVCVLTSYVGHGESDSGAGD